MCIDTGAQGCYHEYQSCEGCSGGANKPVKFFSVAQQRYFRCLHHPSYLQEEYKQYIPSRFLSALSGVIGLAVILYIQFPVAQPLHHFRITMVKETTGFRV